MSINTVPMYIFGISNHHISMPCTWFPSVRIPLACASFRRPVAWRKVKFYNRLFFLLFGGPMIAQFTHANSKVLFARSTRPTTEIAWHGARGVWVLERQETEIRHRKINWPAVLQIFTIVSIRKAFGFSLHVSIVHQIRFTSRTMLTWQRWRPSFE